MKTLFNLHIAVLLAGLPFWGMATGEQMEKSLPDYEITKTAPDPGLKKNESVFAFSFVTVSGKKSPTRNSDVYISYNGTAKTLKTDSKGQSSLKLKPGKYIFQFYYNDLHREVYTDSISIGGGIKTEVTVYFNAGKYPVVAEKPVIYLYPEKTTEVQVQLAVKGNMLFTYPAYENGWSVTAEPDGTLKQGDKTFNYLFWEADMPVLQAKATQLESTVVKKNNLLAYLESTLARLGLNSREAQDFITYWYPRMMAYDQTSIRFLLNENINEYAHLNISPKPDKVLRVFMLWSPGESISPESMALQTFPVFERKGFTVVEWGGMQVENTELGWLKD